jgi:hypothetical protein
MIQEAAAGGIGVGAGAVLLVWQVPATHPVYLLVLVGLLLVIGGMIAWSDASWEQSHGHR